MDQFANDSVEESDAYKDSIDYITFNDGDLEGCKVLLVDDDIRNISFCCNMTHQNYLLSCCFHIYCHELDTGEGRD